MKFIVASYSKTGTKTMADCLRQLGFTVDDLFEHFDKHVYWKRIYTADPNDPIAQTPEIFKEMYADVDATTDTPSYLFWEQMLEAFPDAKVILVERDEDKWWKSLESHFVKERQQNMGAWMLMYLPRQLYQLLGYNTWLGQSMHRDLNWGQVVGACSPFGPNRCNQMMARKRYREHNFYVKHKCPKDKLLVYKLSDGWDPLVKFTGADQTLKNPPTGALPNNNQGGQIIEDVFKLHQLTIEQKNRVTRNLIIFLTVFTLLCYYVLKACYIVYFS